MMEVTNIVVNQSSASVYTREFGSTQIHIMKFIKGDYGWEFAELADIDLLKGKSGRHLALLLKEATNGVPQNYPVLLKDYDI